MSNKVKILSNSEGKCPYCNNTDIEYGTLKIVDDMAHHPCTCIMCKKTFEQWYNFNFIGHNVGVRGLIDANDVLGKEINYEEN